MDTDIDTDIGEVSLAGFAHSARLRELACSGLTRGHADEVFDRFARLAAALLSAPVAYVSLVGHDTQVLPGAVWLDRPQEDVRTLPLTRSMCAISVATGEGTVVEDLATDPLFRDNAEMQSLDVSSYAGYPLTTEDGHVLGNLCVMDTVPRRWTDEELATLRDLSTLVLQEMRHRITQSHLTSLRNEVAALLAEVPAAKESVRQLVESAGGSEDPRLQRTATTATSRVDRLVRAAAGVTDDLSPAHEESPSEQVDLVRTVRRITAGVRAVTGSQIDLHVDAEAADAAVTCDMLAMERAVWHLVVMAIRQSGDVPAQVVVRRDGPAQVALLISATGGRMGAPQLGRAVARLEAATSGVGSGDTRRATLRITGGRVTATAGPVVGAVSDQGTVVTAVWDVTPG